MSGARFAAIAALLFAAAASAESLDLVRAARHQIGVTTLYDGSYRVLAYPGGDVPTERGVCTDVIVRAFRAARSVDLQRLVHEDMRAAFSAYPSKRRWGLSRPDANIDHRRVPNLAVYFQRAGYAVPVSADASAYLPGDLVTWDLGGGIPHIGIVSERSATSGTPLIIHNIGSGAREEDLLFRYAITGHFRPPAARAVP